MLCYGNGVGNHLMMMLHSMTWESSISYREGFKKISGIYHLRGRVGKGSLQIEKK